MSKYNQQRLFWSVSRPIKYLGLTVDEWCIACFGVFPGIGLLNNGNIRLGSILVISGIGMCWLFKRYKRLSQSFKLKSFLIAKGVLKAPRAYPKMLNKERVGR